MLKACSRVGNSLHPRKRVFLAFINENSGSIPADNAMAFLSDDGGESYNRCHCEFMYMFYMPFLITHRKLRDWSLE